jgi:putative polyhydroxyalkanoate system protein
MKNRLRAVFYLLKRRREGEHYNMADIHIKRAHGTTQAKAKKSAQTIAKQLEEKFDLETDWDGDCCSFERTGISGELYVDKTNVEIEITLGLLMRAFKGPIQSAIEENLTKLFPPVAKK